MYLVKVYNKQDDAWHVQSFVKYDSATYRYTSLKENGYIVEFEIEDNTVYRECGAEFNGLDNYTYDGALYWKWSAKEEKWIAIEFDPITRTNAKGKTKVYLKPIDTGDLCQQHDGLPKRPRELDRE